MARLSTLVLIGVFIASALTSHAEYQAYVQVKGVKQGQFKGGGGSKSHNIPVVQFTMPIGPKTPPITIVIEGTDGAEFANAAMTKEELNPVIIQVVKPTKDGKVQILETITLRKASIGTMTQTFDNNGAPLDTITFKYSEIQIQQGTGQVQAKDDWKILPIKLKP